MEKTIAWLLSDPNLEKGPYHSRFVLSAGFSGGLQDGCPVGDLVLATEVVDEQGHCWPATWPRLQPSRDGGLRRGRILSCREPIGNTSHKRSLGSHFQALAVDMESAALARQCHSRGVSFGCLRVISDDVDTSLSAELVALLASGPITPVRAFKALLRSPRLASEFWRLARQTRYAARQLAAGLDILLDHV
jgi:hypothetical protein